MDGRVFFRMGLVTLLVISFLVISKYKADQKATVDPIKLQLFPLAQGNWWEFKGVEVATGNEFKTKIVVGEKKKICGVTVMPVRFFKDQISGYWGPGGDLNLEWLMVDFRAEGSKHPNFLWAMGDKRYRRDPSNFQKLGDFYGGFLYESAKPDQPPYVIFSRRFKLGMADPHQNFYIPLEEDREDCNWLNEVRTKIRGQSEQKSASWLLDYSIARIRVPVFDGEALRVWFNEDFGNQAWIENWYFAPGIGPVMIETFSQGEKITGGMGVRHRLELNDFAVNFERTF